MSQIEASSVSYSCYDFIMFVFFLLAVCARFSSQVILSIEHDNHMLQSLKKSRMKKKSLTIVRMLRMFCNLRYALLYCFHVCLLNKNVHVWNILLFSFAKHIIVDFSTEGSVSVR